MICRRGDTDVKTHLSRLMPICVALGKSDKSIVYSHSLGRSEFQDSACKEIFAAYDIF
ncbi:unknown [Coraliomargarita sp. CAG:312]|nr:unknown [Coraliomargarita sp. CAG:312]